MLLASEASTAPSLRGLQAMSKMISYSASGYFDVETEIYVDRNASPKEILEEIIADLQSRYDLNITYREEGVE